MKRFILIAAFAATNAHAAMLFEKPRQLPDAETHPQVRPVHVPEIDASGGLIAVTLLGGVLCVVRGRRA